MAKASINTGVADQPVHTRTTTDSTESQVFVLGTDGSDVVFDPAVFETALGAIAAADQPANAATVTTSSQLILDVLGTRREATFCNDHSTNVLYLALGPTAVANRGIRLNPGGGSYTTPLRYTGEVAAIATGSGTTLTFTEV